MPKKKTVFREYNNRKWLEPATRGNMFIHTNIESMEDDGEVGKEHYTPEVDGTITIGDGRDIVRLNFYDWRGSGEAMLKRFDALFMAMGEFRAKLQEALDAQAAVKQRVVKKQSKKKTTK